MKNLTTMAVCLTISTILLTGCTEHILCSQEGITNIASISIKPELFVDLGPTGTVPDGMALDANNDIIMSVPNFINYENIGSKIVKIDKDRNVTDWLTDLPKHPETGKAHPMGMEFGPDGNLYYADNQYFVAPDHKSRLIRVIVKDGKPVRSEVVVDNFKLSNAVRWKGNDVYVSDTFFDLPDKKHQSGIYKISLAEMNKGVVKLAPNATDSHLIAQFTAKDFGADGETAGADGMCFDSKGNLYCGNFGDGVISRMTFKPNGDVLSQDIVIQDPSLECCDGIYCDIETDNIYITNSKNNSIHVFNTANCTLQMIWENDDDNGATGLLDQPCEPLYRDGELIVVNFDMVWPGMKNTVNDEYNTLSVFKIK